MRGGAISTMTCQSRLGDLSAVLSRGDPRHAPEHRYEVVGIAVSDFKGYFDYGLAALTQQFLRPVHTMLQHYFLESATQLFGEDSAQAGGTATHNIGDHLPGEILRAVFSDVGDGYIEFLIVDEIPLRHKRDEILYRALREGRNLIHILAIDQISNEVEVHVE